jgi:hypothetical protein
MTGACCSVPERASAPVLPLSGMLLTLLVIAIWGPNFVVIHQGLAQFAAFHFRQPPRPSLVGAAARF